MGVDPSSLRIGIVDQGMAGWSAGRSYSRMILRSLEAACNGSEPQLYFLSDSQDEADRWSRASSRIQSIKLNSIEYLPVERSLRNLFRLPEKSHALRGEPRLRRTLHLNKKSDLFGSAKANEIDVLLPVLDLPPWAVTQRTIGWIPDFQHVFLPEYFGPTELQKRDRTFKSLAARANVIMLSSQAAYDDFAACIPSQIHKARVVSFPSLLAFEDLPDDPSSTVKKYRLPEKFALVANQFWAHKNHVAVVRALERIKEKTKVPVVMTGLPSDHRDPANRNFSSLLQSIATAGLNGQVTILGLVPFQDLINLMRSAALVIQPSRFEGWNTTVQDAVALGRPLMLSDLAVHREQVPGALGFFSYESPETLADLIETHWQTLSAGPDETREKDSLATERIFARKHGNLLLKVCTEAAA